MFSTGLSAANLAAYTRGLADNHSIRVTLLIMDMSHNVLATINNDSGMLRDGQVNVDKTSEITRSASLTLFDPDHTLGFDSNAPTDGSLFLDRMIQIRYGVLSPEQYDQWVDVPIFTGPISRMSRTGHSVQLEMLGKEVLAKRPAWRTVSYGIGRKRRDVILDLMRNVGETRFNLSEWDKKTANVYNVYRETDVWTLAKRMAAGMTFYYDGAGTLLLRPWMSRPIFTFSTGEKGNVTSDPDISYDVDDVKNIVLVKGAIAKGASRPVEDTAYAPSSHPLSAQSLGRIGWDGKRYARHMPEIIEDSDLTTKAQCLERAETELARLLLGNVNVGFDAIPAPHLELDDVVVLQGPITPLTFALDKFSIPLTAGGTSSIGYLQRRSVQRAKIRRKR